MDQIIGSCGYMASWSRNLTGNHLSTPPNVTQVNSWINSAALTVQSAIEAGDSEGLNGWLQSASKNVGVDDLLAGLVVVRLEDVPEDTLAYVREHPFNTACYIFNGVLIVSPATVWGRALAALGFSSAGVQAASIAARWQSTMGGKVGKHGLFATFTSAAMNGYGTAVVNGAVRAGGAFTGIATKLFGTKSKVCCVKPNCTDEGKSGSDGKTDVALFREL